MGRSSPGAGRMGPASAGGKAHPQDMVSHLGCSPPWLQAKEAGNELALMSSLSFHSSANLHPSGKKKYKSGSTILPELFSASVNWE